MDGDLDYGISEDVEKSFQDSLAHTKVYKLLSEEYYINTMYNRINFLLLNDNFHYISQNLERTDINALVKIQLGRSLSIIPQPIINLFTDNFDKRDYLSQKKWADIKWRKN